MKRRSAVEIGPGQIDPRGDAITFVHGKGGRTIRAANTARLIVWCARAANRPPAATAAETSPARKAGDERQPHGSFPGTDRVCSPPRTGSSSDSSGSAP